MTVTDALGAEAAPAEFEHAGETYKLTPVTQKVKSAVEQALRKAAYDDLYALRESMPTEQYDDALRVLGRDRGHYAYLGAAFWEWLPTDAGASAMVRLIFQTTARDAAKLLGERGKDVGALVQEMVLASMPPAQAALARRKLAAREEGGEPDPQAPA